MRGGVKTVLIPDENRKDLADIPKNVTQHMKIVPVKWIDEVLDLALERAPTPRSASQAVESDAPPAGDKPSPALDITH